MIAAWSSLAAQRTLWRWLLVVAMLTLLLLSLLPATLPLPGTGWDKGNHILGFAGLAFIAHWAWAACRLKLLLILLGYGALIEVLQAFTPDRSAEWSDLAADGVGLLVGGVVAFLAQRLNSRSFRKA